jgi:Fur family ferric uptake transcriptional regulator
MTESPRVEPLEFADIDDVAAAIRAAGGRLTVARRRVLEARFDADGPVAAELLAARSPRRGPAFNLTSVYRNLERLEALGVVRHVHLGHGPGLYALTRRGPREYLVCDGCGRIEGVEASRLDRVRSVLREDVGYDVQFGHFPLHGLCPRCARGTGNEAHRHRHD